MSKKEDERLENAIWQRNTKLALKLLSQKERWDDTEITKNTHGRPLRYAVHLNLFEVADALIARGADPNFTCDDCMDFIIDTMGIYPDQIKMLYLLRKGARATSLVAKHQFVQEYIYRQWNPLNHLTWPDPFRARARAILLLSRGPRRTELSMLHGDTLLYLFAWIASSHFQ